MPTTAKSGLNPKAREGEVLFVLSWGRGSENYKIILKSQNLLPAFIDRNLL